MHPKMSRKFQKKFLLCNILAGLFTILSPTQSLATTIVNLDKVPQVLILEVAGAEEKVALMPQGRWSSNAYPIKVKYENGRIGPALETSGEYAIWPGGVLALQRKFGDSDSGK